jgi:hypothetical protein
MPSDLRVAMLRSDKLVALLEKFIEEDRVKTQSIAELSKAVLDLMNEIKNLKGSN